MAFFEEYKKLRFQDNCQQEVYYNIGRAWHQIGFRDFAIQYYRLALKSDPPVCLDKNGENIYDLSSEIAYNMSLIYRNSGNERLANVVLAKYCSC